MGGKGKERASEPLEDELVRHEAEMEVDTRHEDEDEVSLDDDETREENYERERQRRIRENQLLLTSLGISSSTTQISTLTSSYRPSSHASPIPRKKKRKEAVYDRSGYILSLPQGDERHVMAAVEIPADRGLTRRIHAGEYQDCTHWAEGESRRWRFGHGRGDKLGDDESKEVGGVGEDFRWKKWKGIERELRREMRKRGLMNDMDQGVVEKSNGEEVSAYSLLPGDPCHQCRRKSEKLKMRCRNVDPVCRALFCETCCKRYNYFDFDPESRSFICPLCKDCCNCANCIRKRNLAHLLPGISKGGRVRSLAQRLREEGHGDMTVQAWIEQATEDRVGIPFDRVRLVDEATDVITPYLPELDEELQRQKAPVKRKTRPSELGKKKGRPKKAKKEGADGAEIETSTEPDPEKRQSLILKFKIPPVEKQEKRKEVDSDGDTIGDWSGDEDEDDEESEGSALTPISRSGAGSVSPAPPRLPFPPKKSGSERHFWNDSRPNLAVDTTVVLNHDKVAAQDRQPHLHHLDRRIEPRRTEATDALGKSMMPVVDGSKLQSVFSPEHATSPPSSVTSENNRRKRRPPPKAHIIRAPRHSSLQHSRHSQSASPAGSGSQSQSTSPSDPSLPLPPLPWQNMTSPSPFSQVPSQVPSPLPLESPLPMFSSASPVDFGKAANGSFHTSFWGMEQQVQGHGRTDVHRPEARFQARDQPLGQAQLHPQVQAQVHVDMQMQLQMQMQMQAGVPGPLQGQYLPLS